MSVSRLDPKKWTKDGRKWNFHVRYKDLDGKTKQYQSKLFKWSKKSIGRRRMKKNIVNILATTGNQRLKKQREFSF